MGRPLRIYSVSLPHLLCHPVLFAFIINILTIKNSINPVLLVFIS